MALLDLRAEPFVLCMPVTFAPGQLPPVNAFWSITMYDGRTQLLIDNPINRYLLNSPMLPELKKNRDGSITIYVQKDSPGKERESNWLPAPDGPMFIAMRPYWPKTGLPAGCVSSPKDGVQYFDCNGVRYRPGFQRNNLVYVVQ
jgi:hypothetical protein